MSDLIVVPSWLLDGLSEAAAGSPDAQQLLLRFDRWKAHVQWNPALFGNIVEQMERIQAELRQAALILRGEGPLVGPSSSLTAVRAGEFGRTAEAELEAERAARRESRLLPERD